MAGWRGCVAARCPVGRGRSRRDAAVESAGRRRAGVRRARLADDRLLAPAAHGQESDDRAHDGRAGADEHGVAVAGRELPGADRGARPQAGGQGKDRTRAELREPAEGVSTSPKRGRPRCRARERTAAVSGATKIVSASTKIGVPGGVNVDRETVAYWYGPGLCGSRRFDPEATLAHRTACRQTLHSETLGVAHKSLPCGARVRFCYRGRSRVIPVIDRGPYVHAEPETSPTRPSGRSGSRTESTRSSRRAERRASRLPPRRVGGLAAGPARSVGARRADRPSRYRDHTTLKATRCPSRAHAYLTFAPFLVDEGAHSNPSLRTTRLAPAGCPTAAAWASRCPSGQGRRVSSIFTCRTARRPGGALKRHAPGAPAAARSRVLPPTAADSAPPEASRFDPLAAPLARPSSSRPGLPVGAARSAGA
jgi:hypothetical protein